MLNSGDAQRAELLALGAALRADFARTAHAVLAVSGNGAVAQRTTVLQRGRRGGRGDGRGRARDALLVIITGIAAGLQKAG